MARLFARALRLEPVAALEVEGFVHFAPPVADSVGDRHGSDNRECDAEADEWDQGSEEDPGSRLTMFTLRL